MRAKRKINKRSFVCRREESIILGCCGHNSTFEFELVGLHLWKTGGNVPVNDRHDRVGETGWYTSTVRRAVKLTVRAFRHAR